MRRAQNNEERSGKRKKARIKDETKPYEKKKKKIQHENPKKKQKE